MLILAAVNLRGVAESVKMNVVLTLVELSGLAIILGIGAYAVLTGGGEPSRLVEFESSGTGFALMTGVLGATALGFFAFVGFEDSVNMAEETKDPTRTFPRAIFIGVAVTGTIYILVALVSSLLVDPGTLSGSDGPLLEVVKAGGVQFPPQLFALIALFAVTNSALINMMMASRLCYGMANERILPRAMGRVLPKRRTPVVGIVFVTLLALGLVLTGEIEGLGDTTAFLLLCVFAVVNIAVLVLRKDRVDHPHFRTPTALPVLGALTALVLASPLADRPADVYIRAACPPAPGHRPLGPQQAGPARRAGLSPTAVTFPWSRADRGQRWPRALTTPPRLPQSRAPPRPPGSAGALRLAHRPGPASAGRTPVRATSAYHRALDFGVRVPVG